MREWEKITFVSSRQRFVNMKAYVEWNDVDQRYHHSCAHGFEIIQAYKMESRILVQIFVDQICHQKYWHCIPKVGWHYASANNIE